MSRSEEVMKGAGTTAVRRLGFAGSSPTPHQPPPLSSSSSSSHGNTNYPWRFKAEPVPGSVDLCAGAWAWDDAETNQPGRESSGTMPFGIPPSASPQDATAHGQPQIPGRRTPLGAVGIGTLYFSPSLLQHQQQASCAGPRDENSPEPNGSNANIPTANRAQLQRGNGSGSGSVGGGGGGGGSGGGSGSKGKSRQGKMVRLNINARERRRMHDLNDALDELRSVIPYAHSPSVRKLSKIATLLLAKNYILMQANALEEMRRIIAYMQAQGAVAMPGMQTPSGFDLQTFPTVGGEAQASASPPSSPSAS